MYDFLPFAQWARCTAYSPQNLTSMSTGTGTFCARLANATSISCLLLALKNSICRPRVEAAACKSLVISGGIRIVEIDERCETRGLWQQFMQKTKPLGPGLQAQGTAGVLIGQDYSTFPALPVAVIVQ